ncbi:MAG: hypothetical protein PVG35_21850 [Desulfobacterales bacterium]
MPGSRRAHGHRPRAFLAVVVAPRIAVVVRVALAAAGAVHAAHSPDLGIGIGRGFFDRKTHARQVNLVIHAPRAAAGCQIARRQIAERRGQHRSRRYDRYTHGYHNG